MPTIGNLGTMFVRGENKKLVPVPCIQGKNGITPHIGENGNWWIGDTDTGAMADNKKYPVSASVYETIFTGKPSEYTLEILLKDGDRIRAKLPNMGLTPDDVVKIGIGEPSEFDDINYKQFYLDKNTGRLYINTSKMYPNSYITIGGVVLSGENDPTGGEDAQINNLYINTTTGAIFLCVRMESIMPSEPPHPVWKQVGGSGGDVGTDITLGITRAVVGQTAKITEVDENGKPVKWESADIPAKTNIDTTLSIEGSAADAKTTGEALSTLSEKMLTDAELSNAVDNALAQAKESGEFDGPKGDAGIGIQSVVQTTTSTEDCGTNVVTVTKTDGSTSTFQIQNGRKGSAGVTPNIQIGTVETLEAGSDATASIDGTVENPLLNLGIPKGADGASGNGNSYVLPVASADTLGGVKPAAKTDDMTQLVGVDESGALFTAPGEGGSGEAWQLINTITLEEDSNIVIIDKDINGNSFNLKAVAFYMDRVASDLQTGNGTMYIGRAKSGYFCQMSVGTTSTRLWLYYEFMNKHMGKGVGGNTSNGNVLLSISYAGNFDLDAPMIRIYGFYHGAGTKITMYGVRK